MEGYDTDFIIKLDTVNGVAAYFDGYWHSDFQMPKEAMEEIIAIIKKAESSKPKKPIKAMWISGAKDPTGQYFEDEVMCSNCMHSEPQSYMFTENGMICPRCGATMERGPRV